MIEVQELEAFARKCEAAAADLKPYMGDMLDKIGEEFLKLVQQSIRAKGNVDFGKLLASFQKGGAGNIYQLDAGALTLTVGSSIDYAEYVNKGHRQTPGRFVPGVWEGSHFRYVPGAKTGMVLKASHVKGSGFFDVAERAAENTLETYAERAFNQFWARYFG